MNDSTKLQLSASQCHSERVSSRYPGLRSYHRMSIVKAKTNAELQFELQGIIRSYNALYPVTVIADFVATRQAGRFERNDDDDES